MPKRITDANVLVLSGYTRGNISDGMTGGLQDPNVQRDGERIEINSPDDVEKFDRVFSERRERIVAGLTEAGVDVVVTRLGISSEFQDLLVEHDIVGVRRVNRRKLTQLKRAIGATEVRDPTDVSPSDLGHVGVLEQKLTEKRRGRRRRRRILVFDGCCDPESVTVLLQGASGQTKDQAATTIRKGATATAIARGLTPQVGGVVPGGGAPEMQIATAVRGRATAEDSRSQLALEAFADATERLVFVLAKNSGLDPLDTVSELRARETTSDDAIQIGLNLPTGTVTDVLDAGILDPVATRMNCYETAVDVAVMILRVDDAIDAIATQTPTDPDDTIYDDEAEKHHEYLEEHDDTRWDV